MNYKDIQIDKNSEDFIERIIKENLWTRAFALRVIEEYKKFLFIGSIQSVAPSFEIDQVWHAHMLFSRDYKQVCEALMGKFFHHTPTKKGTVSTRDEYQETKDLYIKTFCYQPPADIWTQWKPTHYIYVDMDTHWIIPEGDWRALIRVFFKHLKP